MMLLIIVLVMIVIPSLLVAVVIQLVAFIFESIKKGDFPDSISWVKIPDALTQLTCELGHAFGFDLVGTLEKLAKK